MSQKTSVKPVVIGNWKMNSLVQPSEERILQLISLLNSYQKDVEVIIVPPIVQLHHIAKLAKDCAKIHIAGQDCHFNHLGAHTGDTSALMLKEAGCNYVVLGHVERRTAHLEDSNLIRSKVMAALSAGLKIILCVGEDRFDREAETEPLAIAYQLLSSLPKHGITADNLVIAHEPIWAIGSGLLPKDAEIEEIHLAIRKALERRYGSDVSEGTRICYGGSVTPANSKEVRQLKDVDGLLVGHCALDAQEFFKIISSV